MANYWGYVCPKCGDADHLDVLALIDVRMTEDGTDPDMASDRNHEWDDDSRVVCVACRWGGIVRELEETGLGRGDPHD